MSTREKLLRHKELFYKNKRDIRFLHKAILDVLFEYALHEKDPECFNWIGHEINAEFSNKGRTQHKNAQIGALVAHIVSSGADVLPTLQFVAKWFALSESTIRESYAKIKKTFNFDPRFDSVMENSEFCEQYGTIPAFYVRDQYKKDRPWPGYGDKKDHSSRKILAYLTIAYKVSQEYEQKRIRIEMEKFIDIMNAKDDFI